MFRVCEVCGNSSTETDLEAGDDPLERVTYHQIPLTEGERQQAWLKFCRLPLDGKNLHKKYVCSLHFERQYIQRDLRSELLGGVRRNVLTRNAVPTIRSAKRQKRRVAMEAEAERKRRKEEIERILEGGEEEEVPVVKQERSKVRVRLPNNQTITVERRVDKSPVKKLPEDPVKALKEANEALQVKVAQLEQMVEKKNEKIALAKTEMINITAALQDLKNLEEKNLTIKVNEVLKEYLSENQIRRLIGGNNIEIPWTNEEIINSFTLKTLNSYDFVRTQLKFPLPTPQEMELWVHESYLQTGLLKRALEILKIFAQSLSPRDRECALLLNRTRSNTKYTYDPARDQVIDNSGYLYCIAVQGIFSNWHQIVHLDFDLIYSPDLLTTLLAKLHTEANLNVLAIAGICDQELIDLWTELEITPQNSFIPHPTTKRPVFLLSCAMSILNGLRRLILGEHGFAMHQDGEAVVTKATLQALVNCKNEELRRKMDVGQGQLEYDVS